MALLARRPLAARFCSLVAAGPPWLHGVWQWSSQRPPNFLARSTANYVTKASNGGHRESQRSNNVCRPSRRRRPDGVPRPPTVLFYKNSDSYLWGVSGDNIGMRTIGQRRQARGHLQWGWNESGQRQRLDQPRGIRNVHERRPGDHPWLFPHQRAVPGRGRPRCRPEPCRYPTDRRRHERPRRTVASNYVIPAHPGNEPPQQRVFGDCRIPSGGNGPVTR